MNMGPGSETAAAEGAGPEWLGHLFESYRSRLFGLARLLTGSDSVAEDLVQEAFLRLHASGRVPENPYSYLRVAVINLCRNRFRRLSLERKLAPSLPLPVGAPEIDEAWAAICRLPSRQRAVIVLRFYEDLSEADTAALLGWPKGTVKSTVHRALASLSKELPQ